MTSLSDLKAQILKLTREYSRQCHSSFRPADDPLRQPWTKGTPIPYAGRVFTEDEVEAAKQLNKLKTDLEYADHSKEIKFKPHINLQKWMSYNDHFDSLLEARIDMIDSWVEN